MIEQTEAFFAVESTPEFKKEFRNIDSQIAIQKELCVISRARIDTGAIEMHASAVSALEHKRSDIILEAMKKFYAEHNYELNQYEAVSVSLDGAFIHFTVNITKEPFE